MKEVEIVNAIVLILTGISLWVLAGYVIVSEGVKLFKDYQDIRIEKKFFNIIEEYDNDVL